MHLCPSLATPDSRTAAVGRCLRSLHGEGLFTGWREELLAVSASWSSPPLFLLERAAVPSFGVRAFGVHVNCYVQLESGELEMWVARRSRTKQTWPGALDHMVADVRAAGAASIGLTMYPPYPEGFFKNPQMRSPYSYQNGGDWCWFGGRMIQALIEQGDIAEAYRELRPMVERVRRVGGFYEWWSRDNQPRGSGDFRGSAGVLGRAIELLQVWAEQH